ncbi:MAG: DnaD domain protein [Oscillospiraceae bacterium]|nr:DnaD domain protein [Oscillospiraceae bacterium]
MDDAVVSLPKQDLRKLLGAASGDAALLYLYLRAGFPLEQARESLQMAAPRLDCATAALRQMGLIEETPRFLQQEERPVYTEQDIAREMDKGKSFGLLVGEVQRKLGRVLSTEELKILLSLRDYLRLSDEVISILISFCMQRSRARGNVRAPSMRSIEKEAYYWADNSIDTLEEAAAYMQQQLVRQSRLGSIRHGLQIYDRRLTPSEEKYILKWLDVGFGEPEILLAYDRTCLHAGGLKWNYMDSILTSWQGQNLYTVEQIEHFDRAPDRPRRTAQQQKQDFHAGKEPDPMELKAIERMMRRKEED